MSDFVSSNFDPFSDLVFHTFSCDSSLNPSDGLSDVDSDTINNEVPCVYYDSSTIHNHHPPIDKSNLSLFHLNTSSLNLHNNDVIDYLATLDHHFDIYGFSETWFNYTDDSTRVNLGDFAVENCIREGRQGGGVSLFINSQINYRNRPDLSIICDNCDSLFIEISHNSEKIIIGVVYKPEYVIYPNFLEQLSKTLDCVSNEKNSCYIMGDFNIDLLKQAKDPKVPLFLNLLYSHDFIPCITRPTRIKTDSTGRTTVSLIDNIFTNDISNIINSGIFVTDLSDHFPIFITQLTHRPKTNSTLYTKKRQLYPDNIKGLINALSLVDWQSVENLSNPNEAYNKFIEKFTVLLDIHCPIKNKVISKRNSPKKPWVTKGLIQSIKSKDKLYKQYVLNPTSENKIKYTKYRNYLNLLLRASKKNYITNKIENHKGNTKQIWKTLNNLLGRNKKSKFPDFFTTKDGNKVSDSKLIAEHFNSFFANIGNSLASDIPDPPPDFKLSFSPYVNPKSLFFTPTSPEEIIKLTSNLKNSHSCGNDGISNILLKQVIPSISGILSFIFNLSLCTGTIPSTLKNAHVIPIFKAGDKHDFTNYRPISILPAISKLLERIVYIRILDFLTRHNILTKQQFGFRKNRSTNMAINDLYCRIVDNLDNKLHTIGIFLDLSKAFDTINHNILLDKLYNYGIRGLANDWIRNYLTGRSQRVIFNNCSSRPTEVTCGVPQGSILGPLLFLLYINDLPNTTSIPHFILFADDTNILFSHQDPKTLESMINTELKIISNWFKLNKLSLNIKKTNYIVFKNKYSNKPDCDYNIKIDNTPIQKVETTKFLG